MADQRIRRALICALLASMLALTSWAQTFQGALRGAVKDAAGAAVPNVIVTLVDEATGIKRTTVTNDSGEYNFTAVNPATYTVTAESPSFKKYERTKVAVDTQSTVTVDIALEIGTLTQSVMVTEEVPQIDDSSASNGQVLDEQKLTDLPNLGRNPFLLSKLSTNVVPAGDPRFNRFQDQSGSSQISIGGGPVRGNNYLIDGIPITDSYNRAVIIPSIEATQEMKLQENTYDAAMGRTGGGVFNTVLKTGTNEFHGSLFGYTRQTDWLANNFFYNAAGTPRPDTPFYNWGASFGGPVWVPKVYKGKNKTFFYVTTESYRQKSPLSDSYVLPTAAERAGDFSDNAHTIYNPLAPYTACSALAAGTCSSKQTIVRTAFANNIIPANLINPVGAAVLSLLPNPQTSVVDGVNYTGFDTLTDRADEYTAKLDQEILSWWRVTGSYMHYKSREPGGNTLGTLLAASDASPYLLYRKVDATAVNSIMTLNPTTVLSLRFGFNRFPNDTLSVNAGASPTMLGFPASYASSIQAQYLPEFDLASEPYNFSNVSPSDTRFYSRNFLSSVSKYAGKHSLTMGFDFRTIHTDFYNQNYAAGDYGFTGGFTRVDPNVSNGSGSDFADLLLGYPASGQVDTTTHLYTYVNYYAGYIQDDYRVTSKLTLNLGLRYEYETGIQEEYNHLVVGFDTTATNPLANSVTGITPKGVVEYAGNGNPTSCCNALADKFGPRIGAAYALNSKTVIRAGWGMFYAPTRFADDPTEALGYTQATSYLASTNGLITPANNLSNPFPNGISQPVGNSQGALTGVGSTFSYLSQNRTSGTVYQFSFDVQRQLPMNIAMEVGYIGSRSHDLQTSSTGGGGYDINQVPDSDLSLGAGLTAAVANPYYVAGGPGFFGSATVQEAQLLRPYSEYQNINVYANPAHAAYDSMIVKVQKQMSSGLTFLSAFTWSRNMDNEFGSGNFFSGTSSAPQDAYNLAAEYSLAVNDTPLRWTNTMTYQLPVGRGKMFLNNNKWLDYAVGGWQLNLTNIYQTGFPLAIYSSTNLNSALGTGVQRPNATGVSPVMPGSVVSRLSDYINPAAFSAAPAYTFGDVARTIPYRGPGTANWDMSLFKDFNFMERVKAEFRAEALNAFNTPQFPNPNTKFGSPAFGTITSQVNFSRMLQLGVRFAF